MDGSHHETTGDFYVSVGVREPLYGEQMKWKQDTKCADCPFRTSGPGYALYRTIRRTVWRTVLRNLRTGGHFYCHRTTRDTGDGTNLICAGAHEWQLRHIGQPSDLAQVMERLIRS